MRVKIRIDNIGYLVMTITTLSTMKIEIVINYGFDNFFLCFGEYIDCCFSEIQFIFFQFEIQVFYNDVMPWLGVEFIHEYDVFMLDGRNVVWY